MYDQSNWTVTLVPTQPLGVNQFYSLFLKGTPGGITNVGGIELAGAGAGRPGTNFTALFAQGTNLKYTDAGGNQVTFGVKRGWIPPGPAHRLRPGPAACAGRRRAAPTRR